MTDDEMGLDVEEHPDTGRWRWIWNNAAGASRFGLFKHVSEAECRKAGRVWIKDHQKQAQAITAGDELADD